MTTSNSSSTDEVGQTTGTTQGVQTPKMIAEADYLNLQSESTKWRQEQIRVTTRLVEKDKSELKDITDTKLRDTVVKQLYPAYSSYEEMVAIEGSDFANTQSSEGEDATSILQKQIKHLTFQNDKRDLEQAIAQIKQANPTQFTTDGADAELRDKLKYLSGSIPVGERVQLAAKLAFNSNIDSTTLAFKALASVQVSNNGSTGSTQNYTATDKNADDLIAFLYPKNK